MKKEYQLHEERRTENGWDIDLIWCPSQIYKTFNINNKTYDIYCRWRWDDPWSIELNNINIDDIIGKEYIDSEYKEMISYIDNNIKAIIKEYEELNGFN